MSRRAIPARARISGRGHARAAGVGALALAMITLTAGCGSNADSNGSASGTSGAGAFKPIEAGKLTTCTHLPYPPFQSSEGDKVVGFDMDLIDLVATKLGVTQTVVDTPFEGIKSGQDLNTGKCDIAAAGMTINPARAKVIDFSTPYFKATQALVIKKGAPWSSLESFQHERLGVQSGTTGKEYIESRKLPLDPAKDFEDLGVLQQALATGQVDGAVNDLPVWTEYIKKNPGKFEVVKEFPTDEQYGFGIKKGGNPELLKTVNAVIAAAKADGTYNKIYEKWFGTKPAS